MYNRLGSRITRSLGRAALKPSFLDLGLQLLLILVLLSVLVVFQTARAETGEDDDSATTTTTVTTKTVKKGLPSATPVAAQDRPPENFIVTSKFGSTSGSGLAGCKAEVPAKEVVRELKAECRDWLGERKAELKGKYQTGTCQEECADCSMGLKRCAVNGTAHYRP